MFDQNKILDYLNQTLPPDAERAFEEAIRQDPALACEVALYREIRLALKIYGQEGIAQKLEEVWQSKQLPSRIIPTRKQNIKQATWGYAAVFLLLLASAAALYQFGKSGAPQTLSQRPAQDTSKINKTGGSEEIPHPNTSQAMHPDSSETSEEKGFFQDGKQETHPSPSTSLPSLLASVEQKYKSQQLPFLEAQLSVSRIEQRFEPNFNTILRGKSVKFEWPSQYNIDTLEIEIITKVFVQTPTIILVPFGQKRYVLDLPNGLYYWRLNIKNGEMLHLGRFFVQGEAVLAE
ncbi:MAG: hypothetical protein HC913_04035 [Microscillaceae bacterium]|nr:hypothetical protein [Microscillaceae bacterium]